MNCLHIWRTRSIWKSGIKVEVLSCCKCPKKLVQGYGNWNDKASPGAGQRRRELAEQVRKELGL